MKVAEMDLFHVPGSVEHLEEHRTQYQVHKKRYLSILKGYILQEGTYEKK